MRGMHITLRTNIIFFARLLQQYKKVSHCTIIFFFEFHFKKCSFNGCMAYKSIFFSSKLAYSAVLSLFRENINNISSKFTHVHQLS